MQIVINIDNEDYDDITLTGENTINLGVLLNLREAVRKGTPLPQGHGRIVDIGKIDNDKIESDNPIIYLTVNGEYIEAISLDYLNNLPTIVEADDRVVWIGSG